MPILTGGQLRRAALLTGGALAAAANAAAGGGAFDPSSIAGLKLWAKADALALSDGDPVSSWTDSSGNGRNATQGTGANRPTYKTGIVNGKPVVRFDGTNDSLATASLTIGIHTLFVVLKTGTTSGSWVASIAHDQNALISGFTSGQIETYNSPRFSLGTDTGSFRCFTVVNGASAVTGYANGVSQGSGSPGATRGSNTNIIRIGSSIGGPDFWQGDMAELILYDSALGSTDRASVESYLASKYAL